MAKRTNQMSRNQRNRFGPNEIQQASNKSNKDLKKLQEIYQKSKQKAETKERSKQLARAKKEQIRAEKEKLKYKYLGPEQVMKEYGSVEMFRMKKLGQRRETVKSMLSRIIELVESSDIKQLEQLQKLQPNMFLNAKYFNKLRNMGTSDEKINKADEKMLENYFVSAANVLSYKTIYADERERIIQQRQKENEFIERAYKVSGSKMELGEFRNAYFRMRGLFIDRVKGLYDSETAVEKFDNAFSNSPILNESQVDEIALKIGNEINENAEEVLESNRKAAEEKMRKKQYRNMSDADKVYLAMAEQIGKPYEELVEEFTNEGKMIESFREFLYNKYGSKLSIGPDGKQQKLKIAPNTIPFLRKHLKENDPGDIFEIIVDNEPYKYVVEAIDGYKVARALDTSNPTDMSIIDDYNNRNSVSEIDGFRIEKPIVSSGGSISIPNDEELGDVF